MGPTIGSGLTFLALILGLCLTGLLAFRGRWAQPLAAWIRWCGSGFTLLTLGFMAAEYLRGHDWVHLLWNSTFPQVVLFLAGGAFLLPVRARDARWTALLGACFVLLALAPGVLLQLEPRPGAHPRNVGRPLAGLGEVLAFGLGGPLPETLEPVTSEELARGMGSLPREVSVPVGAVANAALLWSLLMLVRIGGVWIQRPRTRDAFHLLGPFLLVALTIRPLPFGIQESPVWDDDPTLMRWLGRVVVFAVLLTLVASVARRHAARLPPAQAGPAEIGPEGGVRALPRADG